MAGILDEFLLIFKPQVQGSGFQRLNKQLKNTHDSLFSVKNLFGAFIGYDIYTGIKNLFTGLIDASKELGAMESRFYAITKSSELAGKELDWVFNLAERTAMNLKNTADSYSIFYAATQKSLGTNGARDVFESWTEVSRVLHLTDYQFERVTYALREMASKGAIYSQDLRMQIGTHVPNAIGLAQKAAEDLGITGVNWFEKLQDSAKNNQKLINQFIVLFSKHAKKMYASPEALAKALEKPDAQMQRLIVNWQKLQLQMVRTGFEKDLVGILKSINFLLSAVTKHASEFYSILKSIISLFLMLNGLKFLKFITGTKYIKSLATTYKYWSKTAGVFKTLGIILKGSVFASLARLSSGALVALFTTPQGWVILALMSIAGLLNWLKKRFPNLWLAMLNRLRLLLDYLWLFMHKLYGGGDKNKPNATNIRDTILDYYKNNIQATGGLYANTKMSDDEAKHQAYILNRMLAATKTLRATPVSYLQRNLSGRQIEFNVKITNEIKAGNIEGAERILREENPAWIPTLMRQFKNAIRKN